MTTPFIKELKQFALAVDIVNGTVLKNIESLLDNYFKKSLKANAYEIRVPAQAGTRGEVYLETLWSSINDKFTSPLYDNNGSIRGHTSYAVINNKPLWVKSKDNSCLKPEGDYVDLWSKVTDLPSYRDWGEMSLRTSIILPLGSPPIGFMNVEFKRLLEPSSIAKEELKEVAEIIEIFYRLYKSHQIQTNNTERAVKNIKVKLSRCPLEQSSLFFAFSKNADSEVVGIIKSELSQFSEIRVVYWDDMHDAGNIHVQMTQEILDAEYGVCYFSEPKDKDNEDTEILYVDNPNVVFEAGMFHALTSNQKGRSSWIPIREEKSGNIPFDFAADRLLIIKRNAKQKLNEQELRSDIKRRLKSLIEEV